jgi:hypothetical protein
MPDIRKTEACRLCSRTRQTLGSHVFPKFIIRWLKSTGTGYLRYIKQPNVRAQDGPIRRWLCGECEQLFGKNEAYFASSIFPLAQRDKFAPVNYDSRLITFLISLLWRVLHNDLELDGRKADPYLSDILAAEQEWRAFLLGHSPLERFRSIHLFITSLADESPPGLTYFNLYCTRALDGNIITHSNPRFVYAKFGRFMCMGMLSAYDEAKWIGTRIHAGQGTVSTPQQIQDIGFGRFLFERVRGFSERFHASLSANQQRIIASNILQNYDKLVNSDLGKAAFLDEVTEKRYKEMQTVVGRNEPCPCGSGFKFKRCHGSSH